MTTKEVVDALTPLVDEPDNAKAKIILERLESGERIEK